MWSRSFWAASAERAIKTAAQVLAALLVGSATGLFDTDWPAALSVAGMATVISVLTSIASSGVGGNGPSLTDTEVLPPADTDEPAD